MDKCQEIVEKFSEILIKSEERIDRTNTMVSKCVEMMDKLTAEYCKQIEALQESRDEILSQNKILIENARNDRDKYELLSKRYDTLIERLFTMIGKNSENNINVK